jgi:chaperonin GroEL
VCSSDLIQPLIPVLEQVAKSGKPILVVAEDVEGDALQTLLMNNSNGSLKVCAIPAPGFSDRRLPILEDIAILTGATVFSKELCRDLSDIRIEHLGVADRVEVTNLFTTIIGGRGKKEEIEGRINHIKYQISQETDNDYNVDKLKDRLAKLDGGVALIKVGAATEVELKEKKDRYDDALHATRAAVDEGIVPGGGLALLRAKQQIDKIETSNPDQEAGVKIILDAIESPIRQIVINAGKSPDVIIAKVLSEAANFGYDASCDTYGDMIELGIIDPTKVTKTALVNAASVAGLLLTSDCAITEIPERKPPVNREEFYF